MPLPLYYFLSITAVNILMTWSLYLPYRVGQLHFLSVAAMAISGYGAAYMVMSLHLPFWLALLAGFLAGLVLGAVVGIFTAEAPTFTVVIVGFAFISLTRTAVKNIAALGGTLGLFDLPYLGQSPSAHRWIMLAILAMLLLLVGGGLLRFERSRLGRAASVVFADRKLASTLGIDVRSLAMLLQTASTALAGACGVLYAFIYRNIGPDFFGFALIGTYMTILFVGGYATPWGTLIAAPVLYGVPAILPSALASWTIVIYGGLLMIVLVARPEGLVTRKLVSSIGMLHARGAAHRGNAPRRGA
jgi:branched-chain amino acid transport system permease protein